MGDTTDLDLARVEVGDELPPMTKPPITRTILAYFCARYGLYGATFNKLGASVCHC
jgi:hypothetical protein